MARRGRDKLIVLCTAFVFFACGAAALSLERGTVRTLCLAASFAGLTAVAVRQTLNLKR